MYYIYIIFRDEAKYFFKKNEYLSWCIVIYKSCLPPVCNVISVNNTLAALFTYDIVHVIHTVYVVFEKCMIIM